MSIVVARAGARLARGAVVGVVVLGLAASAWATPPVQQNGRIAFFSNAAAGGGDLFAIKADGSGQVDLTNTRGSEEFGSAWSPDGMRIAFARTRLLPDGLPLANLFVMRGDGSQQTQLTSFTTSDEQPADFTWTPDGSSIIFVRLFGFAPAEVWAMNPDGSNQRRLFAPTSDWNGLDVSPDGQKIVYSHHLDGTNDYGLFVRNLDASGDETQLTTGFRDLHPRWSPDGTKIIFDTLQDGPTATFEINADGSNRVQVATDAASPSWSPDGTKIVFNRFADSEAQIWVANADGTNATQLTHIPSPYEAALASWAPRPAAAVKLDALLLYANTLSTKSSISQKVSGVQAAFAEGWGSYNTTCNKTNSVIHEASSESGSILTSEQAATVIAQSDAVRTLLQC
jgi:Tol biopolymer transport system component